LTLSGVIGLFAALSYKEVKRIVLGNERITLDHVFNGTFAVSRTELSWVPEGAPPKLVTLVIVELTAGSSLPHSPKKPEMVSTLLITMVSSS
jgi:dipeptidyl aminopeptidase